MDPEATEKGLEQNRVILQRREITTQMAKPRNLSALQIDKSKATFKTVLDIVEKERDELIGRWYARIKPLIKEKALQLGFDMSCTQGGLSTNLWPYPPGFEVFQAFVNELSDDYRTDFYFYIENGEFGWYMDS